jgi:uncharacterized membrane protein
MVDSSIPFDTESRRPRPVEDAAERDARLTRAFRDFPTRPAARSSTAPVIASRKLNMVLGWFSVGVGLAQLLAPREVNRMSGAMQRPILTRLSGVRQIASGAGLLSERLPATSIWSRVAGDATDLALLGAAMRSRQSRSGRVLLTATMLAGLTALDIYAAQLHRRTLAKRTREPSRVDLRIDIASTPDKLYAFWRDIEKLPLFMSNLQSVTVLDQRTSHWVANAPAGLLIDWDAEVVDDQPGKLIAWRTLPGSAVSNHGAISFEALPDNRGTCVHLSLEYLPSTEAIGAALARWLGGNPQVQIAQDLRRFKQMVEEAAPPEQTKSPMRNFLASLTGQR